MIWLHTHTQPLALSQNNCQELYLSTSDNLVSCTVRVIKWHINIKAYNIVTLSFIASINPQRQTFQPLSVVSPQHLAVLNTFSSSTFTSAHPFIFPSRLIWQLASNFVSRKAILGVSLKSFCCSVCRTKPQTFLWIPH